MSLEITCEQSTIRNRVIKYLSNNLRLYTCRNNETKCYEAQINDIFIKIPFNNYSKNNHMNELLNKASNEILLKLLQYHIQEFEEKYYDTHNVHYYLSKMNSLVSELRDEMYREQIMSIKNDINNIKDVISMVNDMRSMFHNYLEISK